MRMIKLSTRKQIYQKEAEIRKKEELKHSKMRGENAGTCFKKRGTKMLRAKISYGVCVACFESAAMVALCFGVDFTYTSIHNQKKWKQFIRLLQQWSVVKEC
jgi:hypothetical protein